MPKMICFLFIMQFSRSIEETCLWIPALICEKFYQVTLRIHQTSKSSAMPPTPNMVLFFLERNFERHSNSKSNRLKRYVTNGNWKVVRTWDSVSRWIDQYPVLASMFENILKPVKWWVIKCWKFIVWSSGFHFKMSRFILLMWVCENWYPVCWFRYLPSNPVWLYDSMILLA